MNIVMLEILVGGLVSVVTTLIVILYYIHSKSKERERKKGRQIALLKRTTQRLSKEVVNIKEDMGGFDEDYVTEDMCEARQANFELELARLNDKFERLLSDLEKENE